MAAKGFTLPQQTDQASDWSQIGHRGTISGVPTNNNNQLEVVLGPTDNNQLLVGIDDGAAEAAEMMLVSLSNF